MLLLAVIISEWPERLRGYINMDNVIVRILTKIFDLILLNVLFIICSLPVITVGASMTALYAVLLKMAENEEGYIARGFLSAFRKNFRQSTIVWIILLIIGAFIAMDFTIVLRLRGIIRNIVFILILIVALFYAMEIIFIFPLIAKFENTTIQMFKNAILIPAAKLPVAVMIMLIVTMCILVTLLNQTTILYGAIIWNVIGVSLVGYAISFLLNIIFCPFVSN